MRTILCVLALVAAPAAAGPVAVATTPDGSTLTLHDEAGPCIGPARLAVWRSADAKTSVPGCWIAAGERVRVAYLDGDVGNVAVGAFKRPTQL